MPVTCPCGRSGCARRQPGAGRTCPQLTSGRAALARPDLPAGDRRVLSRSLTSRAQARAGQAMGRQATGCPARPAPARLLCARLFRARLFRAIRVRSRPAPAGWSAASWSRASLRHHCQRGWRQSRRCWRAAGRPAGRDRTERPVRSECWRLTSRRPPGPEPACRRPPAWPPRWRRSQWCGSPRRWAPARKPSRWPRCSSGRLRGLRAIVPPAPGSALRPRPVLAIAEPAGRARAMRPEWRPPAGALCGPSGPPRAPDDQKLARASGKGRTAKVQTTLAARTALGARTMRVRTAPGVLTAPEFRATVAPRALRQLRDGHLPSSARCPGRGSARTPRCRPRPAWRLRPARAGAGRTRVACRGAS